VIARIALLAASWLISPLFAQSIRIPGAELEEPAASKVEEAAPAVRKEKTRTPQFVQAEEKKPKKDEKTEKISPPPKQKAIEKASNAAPKEKPARSEKNAVAKPALADFPSLPLTPFIPSNP